MKQPNKESSNTNSKLDAIKELLLGEDRQQFDGKFDETDGRLDHLDNLVESSNRATEKAIAGLRSDILAKMDEQHTALMKRIDELDKDKMAKNNLADILSDAAKAMKKS